MRKSGIIAIMALTAKDLDRIEFGDLMDRLMKEVEKIKEKLALTPSFTRFADLEERVEALEKQILTV